MSTNIDALISRLDKVASVGQNRWKACCPAHADSDPSLAIRLVDDGRILLHCFAGCAALEVVHAVNLELKDLFPDGALNHCWTNEFMPKKPKKDPLNIEKNVVVLAASDRLQNKRLSQADLLREQQAFMRLKNGGYV